jgi:hypothetical protein
MVSLGLLFGLLAHSTFACGPFSTEAVFVFTVHPTYPLERYASGEIGVIQPSYARSYLYVVYRYLANTPFTADEQKALAEFWKERLSDAWDLGQDGWIKAWIEARQKIPGIPESPKIEVYRNREKPNEYETYLNCTKDSFDNAISTLNERVKKYGADSPAVRTWVEGQDQVFANCAEGQHVPAALPSSADTTAQADRNYQIAAANFYATNFDVAQKDFEAIAADSSSSWQPTALYLLARTFVRKASLGADATRTDSLRLAEAQLKKVLADKKLTNTHPASVRLLNLVRLRLHPSERMHELAQMLTGRNANDHLKQDLWDYTTLLDGVLETEEQSSSSAPKPDFSSDDLTDWISTLQGGANQDREHAFSRWQKTRSLPWLVAVLSKSAGKDSGSAALISEALKITSNSPAFASARYHAVRLLMEAGKSAEARSLLDQVLKNNRTQFDAAALNLLINLRMMLSTNLSDFLNNLPRIPASLSWNDDGREIPAELSDISAEEKAKVGKPLYDFDGARVLNTQMPLSVLTEAAKDQSLPNHLRQDLAQAVWIRAVLLDDLKTADELVPILKGLVPSLAGPLNSFFTTPAPDARKFFALYIWLKFPGMEPVVDAGIGRDSSLNEQDSYRDNWWCSAAFTPPTEPVADEDEKIDSFTTSTITSPLFLNEAQRTAGAKEWTALKNLGPMPNYLSKQVIQWATKNPNDQRVPEALHLAVNSTRFGCTNEETGRWSKAAFDLLHRKYPNTTWAKKTKYWFKE